MQRVILCVLVLLSFLKVDVFSADNGPVLDDPLVALPARSLVCLGTEIVRDDLGVSDVQREALNDLRKETISKCKRVLIDHLNDKTNLTDVFPAAGKVVDSVSKDGVARVLNNSQKKRLGQLMLQLEGDFYFREECVRRKLGITHSQKKVIEGILDKLDSFECSPGLDDRDAIDSDNDCFVRELRVVSMAISEIIECLTPKQKSLLDELWGKRVDYVELTRQVHDSAISVKVFSDSDQVGGGTDGISVSYQ